MAKMNITILVFILLCVKILVSDTRSIGETTEDEDNFLKYYGFAPGWGERTSLLDEDRVRAIKKFQEFHGLPVTGVVDEAMKRLMLADRCDMPDLPSARTARFAIRSSKWTTNLRWRVSKAQSITQKEAERIMREAVQEWLPWMTLRISQSNDTDSEIRIEFVVPDASGNHGDGLPFAKNTLAHALYPGAAELSGDVHFNMERPFSTQNPPPKSTEYAIKLTAVHELGHALGLKHSNVRDAIMYPYARRGAGYTGLHADDILGISALYGKCHQSPCINGGTCTHIERSPGYKCRCSSFFTGTNCQTENVCSHGPCRNGATCVNDARAEWGYVCQCPESHTGTNCEIENLCQNDTCQNGGKCSTDPSVASGYVCHCQQFYYGTHCETETLCAKNPCQNNGVCRLEKNSPGYSCSCLESFSGYNCEEVKITIFNDGTDCRYAGQQIWIPLLTSLFLSIRIV